MIDSFKNEFCLIMYNLLSTVFLYMAKYFPVPQEVYDETMRKEPYSFAFIPDCFKTQEMCNEVVRKEAYMIHFVPDHFWMQKMCNEIIRNMPEDALYYISDCLKTQKMCEKEVKDNPSSLHFVPDWFVTQEEIKMWHDDDVYCNDDGIIEWYEGYKKRKAQKALIKKG